MTEKNYCIGYICIHKRDESIVFAVSIRFCDESGLAIWIAKLIDIGLHLSVMIWIRWLMKVF